MTGTNRSLPEEWEIATLEEVCSLITDGTHHSPPNGPSGAYKYVTAKNIKPNGLDLSDITYVSEEVHREIYTRCPVESGDVLYIKDGATTGIAAVNTLEEEFSVLSSVALLKPHKQLLDAYFLKHWLNSPETLAAMMGSMSGSAIRRLVLRTIRAAEIPIPPLPEQHRIIAKIEELRTRSRRTRKALDAVPPLLKRFRQSVLGAAFRGDLTADWRERNPDVEPASMLLERIRAERRRRWEETEIAKIRGRGSEPKDDRWRQKYEEPAPAGASELAELPEGWCWASLEELSSAVDTICYGVVQPGSEIDGGVPLLRVCDIEEGQIRTDDLRSISHHVDQQYARSRLQGREVVVTVVGTIGRVAVVPEALRGANIARAVARIVPLPQVQAAWIGAALQTPRAQDWLAREAREVARKTLNIGTLARTAIPLAPLPEMQLIGSLVPQLLARAHSLEAAARVMSDRLDLQDQSILAKAFRGELVPQDPNDEPAAELLARIRAGNLNHPDEENHIGKRTSRKSVIDR